MTKSKRKPNSTLMGRMGKRNVGAMGEHQLSMWASDAGITANRVEQDETGWDHFLEFPLPRASRSVPLDTQPKPLQCLLQVKATDGRAKRVSVKLDNWLRLVKTSLPAFFLVMEFDRKPTCQRAYLVHVGEERIREVLHRLRELSVGSSAVSLHKRSLTLRYTSDDELPSLGGAGLEKAIRRHVGHDPDLYERTKRELIKSVGYEERLGELRLMMLLPADDAHGHLVDFALGRVDGLELAGGELRDVRFGIPAPEPKKTFPQGSVLRGGTFVQDTVLRFRWKRGKQARMKASVYSPRSVAGLVDHSALKVRITNPFFELVATLTEEADAEIVMSLPDPDEPILLTELNDFAGFLLLNHEAGAVPGAQIDVRFTLAAAPDREILQRMPALPVSAELRAWAIAVQNAWGVAEAFGIQEDSLVTQREIIRQADSLGGMRAALRADHGESSFTICAPRAFREPGAEVCIPWVHSLRLGKHRMVIPVAYSGVVTPAGTPQPGQFCYHVATAGAEVTNEQLLSADAPFAEEDVLSALESVASACADRAHVWRWWDP